MESKILQESMNIHLDGVSPTVQNLEGISVTIIIITKVLALSCLWAELKKIN